MKGYVGRKIRGDEGVKPELKAFTQSHGQPIHYSSSVLMLFLLFFNTNLLSLVNLLLLCPLIVQFMDIFVNSYASYAFSFFDLTHPFILSPSLVQGNLSKYMLFISQLQQSLTHRFLLTPFLFYNLSINSFRGTFVDSTILFILHLHQYLHTCVSLSVFDPLCLAKHRLL